MGCRLTVLTTLPDLSMTAIVSPKGAIINIIDGYRRRTLMRGSEIDKWKSGVKRQWVRPGMNLAGRI